MNSVATAVTKPYMAATQMRSSSPVMVVKRAAAINGTNESVYKRLHPAICQCQQSPKEVDDLLPAEKAQQKPALSAMAHPSASSSSSSSSIHSFSNGTEERRERRAAFNPADHFAQQSMRSSRMAGKGRTREQFRRTNQMLNDLLLVDHSNVEVEIIERSIGSISLNEPEAKVPDGKSQQKVLTAQ